LHENGLFSPSKPISPVGYKVSVYDRQLRLSFWQQDIIDRANVLVIGVGALGCEITKNLALAGIGRINIVDCDKVEVSNLNRQMLFQEKDVGRYKAEVAKARLEEMNPLIRIRAFTDRIQDLSSKIIQAADVIVSGLDLWEPRLYLNAECVRLNKPLIDGGIRGYIGRVRHVLPHENACLVCDNTETPEETQVTEPCTLVGVPRVREHCVWKALYQYFKKYGESPKETDYNAITQILMLSNNYARQYKYKPFEEIELRKLLWNKVPSIITVSAVIAGVQAQQTFLRLHLLYSDDLTARNKSKLKQLRKLGRIKIPALVTYNALLTSFQSFDLLPDPDCPVCGIKRKTKLVKAHPFETIQTLIERAQQIIPKLRAKEIFAFRADRVFFPEDVIGKVNLRSGDTIILKSGSGGMRNGK